MSCRSADSFCRFMLRRSPTRFGGLFQVYGGLLLFRVICKSLFFELVYKKFELVKLKQAIKSRFSMCFDIVTYLLGAKAEVKSDKY